MEKQLTIVVPNAPGEEGLTRACKRGELFRNNADIERYYKQGYCIHSYAIVNDKAAETTDASTLKVFFKKYDT